jgi:hypothetical protein
MFNWLRHKIERRKIEKYTAKYNKEQQEFGKKLESEGHKCVLCYESYPVHIEWCKQTVCIGYNKYTKVTKDKKELNDNHKYTYAYLYANSNNQN